MNKNATPSEQIANGLMKPAEKFGMPISGQPDTERPEANSFPPVQLASLKRRLVSMLYELLLLAALLLVASFAYIPIFGVLHGPFQKAVFQLYLLVVVGVYFVTFWVRGGQTLAMKTWHIRLVSDTGAALPLSLCTLRFALAFAGLLCAGLGFLWALVDREHQFLHDRLARTRLVKTD